MRKILVLIFLWFSMPALAQKIVELDQRKTIRVNGQVLLNGFSLGINSAQIQTMDLTGDGKRSGWSGTSIHGNFKSLKK